MRISFALIILVALCLPLAGQAQSSRGVNTNSEILFPFGAGGTEFMFLGGTSATRGIIYFGGTLNNGGVQISNPRAWINTNDGSARFSLTDTSELRVNPRGNLTSMPTGWNGAWVWDLYAEGTIAAGTNGAARAGLSRDGNLWGERVDTPLVQIGSQVLDEHTLAIVNLIKTCADNHAVVKTGNEYTCKPIGGGATSHRVSLSKSGTKTSNGGTYTNRCIGYDQSVACMSFCNTYCVYEQGNVGGFFTDVVFGNFINCTCVK